MGQPGALSEAERERIYQGRMEGKTVVAGVAGAFLLDYLDTTIRDCDEVEALGIPVLAEIPRRRRH